MSKISFFTRYNPPPSPSLKCEKASSTRQEFAAECDLNQIMERYAAGMAPIPSGNRAPMFGDFSDVPDYQDALSIVQDAQEKFDALPSKVRERFDNDPGALMEFLADEKNVDEARALGLLKAPAVSPVVSSEPNSPPEPSGGKE